MSRYVKTKRDGVVTTRDCLERAADGRRLIHNGSLGGRSTNSGQTYPLDSTRYGHVRRAHQAPNSLHLIRLGRRQRDSESVKPPQKKKKAVSVKKISKPRKMAQSCVPTNRVSQTERHRNIPRVHRRPRVSPEVIVISDSDSESEDSDDEVIYVGTF